MNKKRVALVIIDGFGHTRKTIGNPVKEANISNILKFYKNNPHLYLNASEEFVGLTKGEPGSSEVGHMTIGAGYVSMQPYAFIEEKIKSLDIYQNKVILDAFDYAIKNNKKIHLVGQVSNAGIHSHMNHFYPFLEIAKKLNFNNIFIHAITDGRDTPIQSSPKYIKMFLDRFKELNVGALATISGRYYSMDRTSNYNRIEKSYDIMISHKGNSFKNPIKYLHDEYKFLKENNLPVTDEYIRPAYNETLGDSCKVIDGDIVIHLNLRADRAIEFSSILSNVDLQKKYLPNSKNVDIKFISLLFYANSVNGNVIYERLSLDNTLAKVLEANNKSQLRIAETEKFAHVTFFFDGAKKYDGIENPLIKNCKKVLIPSLSVNSYIDYPMLKAKEITDTFIKENDKNFYDFTLLNFANCDLVGHTANYNACIKALEIVDECIKRIYEYCKLNNIVLIITADHGNIEEVYKKNKTLNPSHTLNLVPFGIYGYPCKLKKEGSLANIAATILEILDIKKPSFMEEGLIIHES